MNQDHKKFSNPNQSMINKREVFSQKHEMKRPISRKTLLTDASNRNDKEALRKGKKF